MCRRQSYVLAAACARPRWAGVVETRAVLTRVQTWAVSTIE